MLDELKVLLAGAGIIIGTVGLYLCIIALIVYVAVTVGKWALGWG